MPDGSERAEAMGSAHRSLLQKRISCVVPRALNGGGPLVSRTHEIFFWDFRLRLKASVSARFGRSGRLERSIALVSLIETANSSSPRRRQRTFASSHRKERPAGSNSFSLIS